jgi:hypothetical protein
MPDDVDGDVTAGAATDAEVDPCILEDVAADNLLA